VVAVIGAIFGGVEAGLVFALKVGRSLNSGFININIFKAGTDKDIHWPVILMGVVSTILLSAGVLRHYWDIYIHRTVRGISFIFVAIDAAGDVFSLISVCTSCLEISIFRLLVTDSLSLSTKA
jgi:hypothetical protein